MVTFDWLSCRPISFPVAMLAPPTRFDHQIWHKEIRQGNKSQRCSICFNLFNHFHILLMVLWIIKVLKTRFKILNWDNLHGDGTLLCFCGFINESYSILIWSIIWSPCYTTDRLTSACWTLGEAATCSCTETEHWFIFSYIISPSLFRNERRWALWALTSLSTVWMWCTDGKCWNNFSVSALSCL